MRPRNTQALGYLQTDVKYVTPELSGLGYTCYEYSAIDILSRYKVALLLPVLDEAGALISLRHAVQTYSFAIRYVQTDNGLEFQRRFHDLACELGIDHWQRIGGRGPGNWPIRTGAGCQPTPRQRPSGN